MVRCPLPPCRGREFRRCQGTLLIVTRAKCPVVWVQVSSVNSRLARPLDPPTTSYSWGPLSSLPPWWSPILGPHVPVLIMTKTKDLETLERSASAGDLRRKVPRPKDFEEGAFLGVQVGEIPR